MSSLNRREFLAGAGAIASSVAMGRGVGDFAGKLFYISTKGEDMKTVISDVNCTYTTEVIAFFNRIAAEHPNAVFYKKNISFTPTECIFARTKNGASFGQFVRAMFNDGELGTVTVAGVSSASQMKLTQGDEFIVIDI